MEGPNADDILNLEEASHYLRIKRRTLYSLAAKGEVPAAKIGGQWRFRRSQLDGLFEKGQQPARLPTEGSMVP
jgi:excisionase family DNA binding protein